MIKKKVTKVTKPKQSDEELVTEFMHKLKHPFKAEIEVVREIIKSTDNEIKERIKWNAPSYYYGNDDMVTFNPRATEHVHLVFHHNCIEKIKSPLLQGEYKGRRMTYFNNMNEVKSNKKELEKIIKEIIKHIK